MFLAFSALAVDSSIILNQRVKLQNITEQSALTGASYFNDDDTAQINTKVHDIAEDTFELLRLDSIKEATVIVTVNGSSKMVYVESEFKAQPIFLSFLGVSTVKLAAKACAKSSSEIIDADYGDVVKWLTPSAAYFSSVISSDTSVGDSAIVKPIGGYGLASMGDEDVPDYTLIDGTDEKGLSLGPGGYVTIKLPVPIVDKSGNDLYIKEIGAAKEGYSVFAGLDVDPTDSTDKSKTTGYYVDADHPGKGLKWVNITCTGTSADDITSPSLIYTPMGGYTKIYGSAYFDIGATCSASGFNGVSMVKYIRIVDDNEESAYYKHETNLNYYPTYPLGEASTATAGADIGQVKILNFVQLVKASEFTP